MGGFIELHQYPRVAKKGDEADRACLFLRVVLLF